MRIKKQYRDAIKIQTLQYKALQKQVVERAPRDQHKELIKQLREDRMRKMADLALQYDQSIAEMLQRQTVSSALLGSPPLDNSKLSPPTHPSLSILARASRGCCRDKRRWGRFREISHTPPSPEQLKTSWSASPTADWISAFVAWRFSWNWTRYRCANRKCYGCSCSRNRSCSTPTRASRPCSSRRSTTARRRTCRRRCPCAGPSSRTRSVHTTLFLPRTTKTWTNARGKWADITNELEGAN